MRLVRPLRSGFRSSQSIRNSHQSERAPANHPRCPRPKCRLRVTPNPGPPPRSSSWRPKSSRRLRTPGRASPLSPRWFGSRPKAWTRPAHRRDRTPPKEGGGGAADHQGRTQRGRGLQGCLSQPDAGEHPERHQRVIPHQSCTDDFHHREDDAGDDAESDSLLDSATGGFRHGFLLSSAVGIEIPRLAAPAGELVSVAFGRSFARPSAGLLMLFPAVFLELFLRFELGAARGAYERFGLFQYSAPRSGHTTSPATRGPRASSGARDRRIDRASFPCSWQTRVKGRYPFTSPTAQMPGVVASRRSFTTT